MDRRDFIRLAGAGVAAGTTQASIAARQSAPARSPRSAPRTVARMKVGTQHDSSDEVLGVLAALGVTEHLQPAAVGAARRAVVG